MEHEYDCHTCGSIYKVKWEPDEVELPYSDVPEHCPFCGAKQDSVSTEDIGIGFTEQIDFDGSVEVVDGDEF
jgi:DNA-directed RNA polymerase subunit RPC12/RpoP